MPREIGLRALAAIVNGRRRHLLAAQQPPDRGRKELAIRGRSAEADRGARVDFDRVQRIMLVVVHEIDAGHSVKPRCCAERAQSRFEGLMCEKCVLRRCGPLVRIGALRTVGFESGELATREERAGRNPRSGDEVLNEHPRIAPQKLARGALKVSRVESNANFEATESAISFDHDGVPEFPGSRQRLPGRRREA